MGLLDGLISNVLGSAIGGGAQQGNNPLGSLLTNLSASLGGGQASTPAGAVTTGGAGGGIAAGGLLAAAMALVQQQGGLGALLEKFRQSGLGQHADSWVGKGPNLPVTGDQLQQALGSGALSGIAAKLGIPVQQAGASMAQLLPELVNQLTPHGQLPADHGTLLQDGLKILQGLGH
jgi:uncharacterized protein YidB (DUF937 family)